MKINPLSPKSGKTLLQLLNLLQDGDELIPELLNHPPVEPPAKVIITFEHLTLMAPSCPDPKLFGIVKSLNDTMEEFQINENFERSVMFLAQCLHESGEFKYAAEIASGEAYETRRDLGNTPERDGDGPKFKGHGYMQITGHDAHELFGEYIIASKKFANIYVEMYGELPEKDGNPCLLRPQMITSMPWAVLSAGWVWGVFKDLNDEADRGDFLKTTKRINGGTTNQHDRIKYLNWAVSVLAEYKHLSIVPEQKYLV